jgi:hypothetical protein
MTANTPAPESIETLRYELMSAFRKFTTAMDDSLVNASEIYKVGKRAYIVKFPDTSTLIDFGNKMMSLYRNDPASRDIDVTMSDPFVVILLPEGESA